MKIINCQHFAEWEKYQEHYPSDKYEWNPDKMTYTDTLYTISLGNQTLVTKMAGGKIISKQINQKLIDELLRCGLEMKKELAELETANNR